MKRPNWTKNITKKMIVIWSLSFVGIVAIAFGAVALGLGLSSVTYGKSISYNNIYGITYMNNAHSKEIFKNNSGSESHENTIQEILRLLGESGKTNQLTNMFRGNPTDTVSINTSSWTSATSFTNEFATNALIINFAAGTPQYHVMSNSNRTHFYLADADTANGGDPVYAIYIPLDRTQNTFQEQTWYFRTTKNGTSLNRKMTTYGNYHNLGNYIGGCFVQP